MKKNMNIRSNMKKRMVALLFGFILAIGTASAQVFIMDDEEYSSRNGEGAREIPGFINNPGFHGSGQDWFVPAGSGVLLLVGFGAAYLLGKSRKRKNEE